MYTNIKLTCQGCHQKDIFRISNNTWKKEKEGNESCVAIE